MKRLLTITMASLMLFFASCTKEDLPAPPALTPVSQTPPTGCGKLIKMEQIFLPSTQPYVEWFNGLPVWYYWEFTVEYSNRVYVWKLKLSEISGNNYILLQQYCR